MAKITISVLRSAIKTALEDNAVISGYKGIVKGYDGEDKNAQKIEALKFPAILIRFIGRKYEADVLTLEKWHRIIAFEIIVLVRNEISEEARTDGINTVAVGIWEVLDAVGNVLDGQNLALDIEKIQPQTDGEISDDPKWKITRGKITYVTRDDFNV